MHNTTQHVLQSYMSKKFSKEIEGATIFFKLLVALDLLITDYSLFHYEVIYGKF